MTKLKDLKLNDDLPSGVSSYNDLSDKPTIPTALSGLSDDATHRLVTDTEKSTWNGKSDFAETFETVSKNLKNYPYTLNYTVDDLTSIVYDLGGGLSITKTFSGNTIVLSGDTPLGITLTKTFNYTGDKITSVSYT